MTACAFLNIPATCAPDCKKQAQEEFEKGNFENVLKLLRNEHDPRSLVLKNRALYWSSDSDNKYILEALKSYPNDSDTLVGMGYSELYLRHYKEGFPWFKKALAANPHNAQALVMLGLCEIKENSPDQGSKHVQEALALDSKDELVLEMVALVYETRLDVDNARKYYDRLTDLYPGNPHCWVLKGDFVERLGKHEEARKYYSKALQANPHTESAYLQRAKTFVRQSDYKSAERDCTSCINLKTRSEDISKCFRLRATCYEKLSQPEKAIADLKSFLSLIDAPHHRMYRVQDSAYLEIVRMYEQLKNYKEADHYLAILRELQPRNTQALEEEAKLFTAEGNYARAIEDYDKLIERNGTMTEWKQARAELERKLSSVQKK